MAQRASAAFPSQYYINRELSWLEFNNRVLQEAQDQGTPLLERLKFLTIVSSNFDEFFEVRVAGLHQQTKAGVEPQDYGADGMDPADALVEISRRVHETVDAQYATLLTDIMPRLAEAGIEWVRTDQLTPDERAYMEHFFDAQVYPVLTPLAIDPGHPFPHVHNKSLNIALLIERELEGRHQELFAVVQVPGVLERVVLLPRVSERRRFLLLEDVIAEHLHELFSGFSISHKTFFRISRNTDLVIDEDEAEDLLETIEETLRQRFRGDAVRLEISRDADERFVQVLRENLEIDPREVYRVPGPIDLVAFAALQQLDGFKTLREEPLVPRVPQPLSAGQNIFDAIRAQDILVHHPYESFGSVVDFIDRAADDPNVLAIKQTLYRTSAPSPFINALARAAQNGKQVTALVELKARYDEKNNMVWARSLEQAGVHVVYGVVGLKTHCKAALVVRREHDGIRRYVHLATGNYNPQTARIYTDVGLFTAQPSFGDDVSEMFNLLTGYSQRQAWTKLVVAPVGLRERVVELIDRERAHAEAGRTARIIVKMNALVEPTVIDALYRAAQAGVTVDLIIRGICCLRPGVPGFSERIRVISIVDRFLEHSRIFYFDNDGKGEVHLGSADWMPRNFFRRIEVMFPVEEPRLKARIVEEILPIMLADNLKARQLLPDGSYARLTPPEGAAPVRAQIVLQHVAREAARDAGDKPLQFVPIIRHGQVLFDSFNGPAAITDGDIPRSAEAP